MLNSELINQVLQKCSLSEKDLANYLGTSHISLARWARGDIDPGNDIILHLKSLLNEIESGRKIDLKNGNSKVIFASRGIRNNKNREKFEGVIKQLKDADTPIIYRLRENDLWGLGKKLLPVILSDHRESARTVLEAAAQGISAGKNTYTYDAHTYHTKVPPQGIAQVIKKYLPEGGLVLDPFAGSGMTGVAALTTGNDVILNELSPAASFIADRFTSFCEPARLAAAIELLNQTLASLRHDLYTTKCRTCFKETELLFTVWSYKVI
ncbi:DNA methyltransferase [Methylophilus aquaticus]|uniref:site-specific DNA-methyltransferase (adenine-specific) n=1 Tax=Methylophilus aquaticus TaxID=1971610 RepID=A0ABT9JU35_9PROT|nr:DNA methyltransferase [Methylophilus aquaticus]MDP8567969.1 DNA methyltransferase [Methylophilus aquaticus]